MHKQPISHGTPTTATTTNTNRTTTTLSSPSYFGGCFLFCFDYSLTHLNSSTKNTLHTHQQCFSTPFQIFLYPHFSRFLSLSPCDEPRASISAHTKWLPFLFSSSLVSFPLLPIVVYIVHTHPSDPQWSSCNKQNLATIHVINIFLTISSGLLTDG